MQGFEDLLSTMAALASALGCGLLVGVERERRKGEGPFRSLAGVRSFALASLAGASAALLDSMALVAVGAAFIAALGLTAYARDRSGDPGVTTEIALFLVYLIGVLCMHSPALAAGLAVVVTGLLAAHRVGMKTVILPRRNEVDLDELPDEVRKTLQFVLVERIEQVWKAALLPAEQKAEKSGRKRKG